MGSETLKDRFDAVGFVVIQSFLAEEELCHLQKELDRYIREVVPQVSEGDAFYQDKSRPETLKQLHRIEQDPFFAEYLTRPLWRDTAEELLGESTLPPKGAEWFNKPPGESTPTPPHQDNFYFCLSPPKVLTMWLALDPVDEENGCLRYVPGSHRHGVRPHGRTETLGFSQGITDYGPTDRAQEVSTPAAPGDVLIHHGNTIHRADPNRSGSRHRRSFGLVIQAASCVRDNDAYQRYLQATRAQHKTLGV